MVDRLGKTVSVGQRRFVAGTVRQADGTDCRIVSDDGSVLLVPENQTLVPADVLAMDSGVFPIADSWVMYDVSAGQLVYVTRQTKATSIIEWPDNGTGTTTRFNNMISGKRLSVGDTALGSCVIPPAANLSTAAVVVNLLLCNQSENEAAKKWALDLDYQGNRDDTETSSAADGTEPLEFDVPSTTGRVWFEQFTIPAATFNVNTRSLSFMVERTTSTAEPTSTAPGNKPMVCSGSFVEFTTQ